MARPRAEVSDDGAQEWDAGTGLGGHAGSECAATYGSSSYDFKR